MGVQLRLQRQRPFDQPQQFQEFSGELLRPQLWPNRVQGRLAAQPNAVAQPATDNSVARYGVRPAFRRNWAKPSVAERYFVRTKFVLRRPRADWPTTSRLTWDNLPIGMSRQEGLAQV